MEKKEITYELSQCFNCGKVNLNEDFECIDDDNKVCSCDHYCKTCYESQIGNFFGPNCVYCILDGKRWGYEWDDLFEISLDIIGVTEHGRRDASRYLRPYEPTKEKFTTNMSDYSWDRGDFRNETATIRYLYEEGFYKSRDPNHLQEYRGRMYRRVTPEGIQTVFE